VPSSLSYENEEDEVPIYTAALSKESVQYVPLLANTMLAEMMHVEDCC
jgi:hypothetical protein